MPFKNTYLLEPSKTIKMNEHQEDDYFQPSTVPQNVHQMVFDAIGMTIVNTIYVVLVPSNPYNTQLFVRMPS